MHYRLADVVGSLSVVADLGFGLPPQQAMRSSLIATDLARRLAVDEEDLRAAFYVPLLMHIGCISMSHETAALFGNEIAKYPSGGHDQSGGSPRHSCDTDP